MNIEELEETTIKVVEAELEEDQEEQMLADLQDGISLLGKVMTLLNFLADPDLCKGLTKRERETMNRLAEKVRSHLAEVEPSYAEVGE